MTSSERTRTKKEIERYLTAQFSDQTLNHLERVAEERVAGVRHEVWDAHIGDERWWVVTNPMHYYTQADFKSRDVVLTFHLGLMMRVMSRDTVPITREAAGIFPSVWRRWEQAVEAPPERSKPRTFKRLVRTFANA